MEVITIDTKAFQELETKLNIIYQYISAIETTKVYTKINRRNYYLESDVQHFLINYFDKNGHIDDKTKFKKKSRIKVPLDTEKSL